jgi:hypothetical protein
VIGATWANLAITVADRHRDDPATSALPSAIATFFGVREEGPLTMPIDGQEAAALDEQCGMQR